MKLTEYAKRRGVSLQAISKAVKVGRLARSVGHNPDGTPFIADPELADQEMDANTRQSVADPVAPAVRAAVIGLPVGIPPYRESQAVRAAADARRAAALAELAELETARRREELADAAEVTAAMNAAYAIVKSKMREIPSLFGQRMPDLAPRVVPMLESLIDRALLELSEQ